MQTERILPLDFEWKKVKAERKIIPLRGYNIERRSSGNRKFDDEFIAHLRWVYEDCNKPMKAISCAYPEIDYLYLRKVLTYDFRAKVKKHPCNLYMRDV